MGICSLKFNTKAEFVAFFTITPLRHARMPSHVLGRDKLDDVTVSTNQKMGGYTEVSDLLKIRMSLRVERVCEEFRNVRPTKFARGQRYIVDHDELNRRARRPLPVIR